jgi:hypothetical protein
MTTQPSVTQGQQHTTQAAATDDAAKVRRVLSVREPKKDREALSPSAGAAAKSSTR